MFSALWVVYQEPHVSLLEGARFNVEWVCVDGNVCVLRFPA